MAKRKKKSLIVRLVEEMDAIAKAQMFARDRKEWGNKCGLCGRSDLRLDWNHLISKTKYSVRWNPINIYAFCIGCNMRHEFNPQYYTAWWLKRHGAEAYQALVAWSNIPAKFKSKDLKAMIEKAKAVEGPENDI